MGFSTVIFSDFVITTLEEPKYSTEHDIEVSSPHSASLLGGNCVNSSQLILGVEWGTHTPRKGAPLIFSNKRGGPLPSNF